MQQTCHHIAADSLFADVAKEGVGCDSAVGTAIGHLLYKVQQGLGQGARVTRDDVDHRLKHMQQLQFSSRWYLCAHKSPYALHPISQKFPNTTFETVPVFI